MNDRQTIAKSTADALEAFRPQLAEMPVTVGFDGMVDSIRHVVDQRYDVERYDTITQMEQFGQRIVDAAGRSANFEFALQRTKLGGNGPIMANALLEMSLPVSFMGTIGYPEVHPVFADFAQRCEHCMGISDPGFTDAVEFHDGKLMLGKLENCYEMNFESIRERIGESFLLELLNRSTLLSMVNWTMLPYMTPLWQSLIDEIFPKLPVDRRHQLRIFVDLADPRKRSVEDIAEALELLSRMSENQRVTLGLNYMEAVQVARVLGLPDGEAEPEPVIRMAGDIRAKLNLQQVVVHPIHGAGGVRIDEGEEDAAWFDGPFIREPVLSTGAGDNFNAGVCLAWLADMDMTQTLCLGTATSGSYVRQGGSPTIDQLIEFMHALPPSEKESS